MSQSSARRDTNWQTRVFKNRGLLLVPVALVLVLFGSPTLRSAIVGIAVALIGELLRVWAVGYSGVTTRSEVVTAPELVTAGPYAYARNPLYIGNAIIALGFWLAFSGNVPMRASLFMLAVVALLIVAVYAIIIPLEESYLAETFGAEYESYRRLVARIVPLSSPLSTKARQGKWRAQVIARAEIVTLAYFGLMVVAVIIKLRAAR